MLQTGRNLKRLQKMAGCSFSNPVGMKICFFFLCIVCSVTALHSQEPIPCAHAHNDYMNDAPLFDALDHGFKSIEIDVCLEGNNLKVAHGKFLLKLKKTLEELYLDPIREWIRLNGGTVYKNDPEPLVFMIDLKGDGRKSYPVLHSILSRYEDILTIYYPDSVHHGPVRICVSGSRPYDLILAQSKRYVTIDGTIGPNVYSDLLPTQLERVSDPYHQFFKWNGIGRMPAKQKKLLQELVKNAHAHGREIRFYAAGNNKKIWRELLDAGVDWINVDDLGKFKSFYKQYSRSSTTIEHNP